MKSNALLQIEKAQKLQMMVTEALQLITMDIAPNSIEDFDPSIIAAITQSFELSELLDTLSTIIAANE